MAAYPVASRYGQPDSWEDGFQTPRHSRTPMTSPLERSPVYRIRSSGDSWAETKHSPPRRSSQQQSSCSHAKRKCRVSWHNSVDLENERIDFLGERPSISRLPAVYDPERRLSELIRPRTTHPSLGDGQSRAPLVEDDSGIERGDVADEKREVERRQHLQQMAPAGKHSNLDISLFHEILFVGVVVVANFMALAGLAQALSPMKIISADLGIANPGQESWFAASYALATGTCILISGRMGDILGHKRMFVFGYFLLGCWSGFAGFASLLGHPIYLDVCRGFQGLAAAILAPNALALLGRAYPSGLTKNLIFALFGAMAPWGFVMGSIYAAVLAEWAWWPWAFWSYGIAAWSLALFALLVIPKALAYDAQFVSHDKPRMDWMGSLLGVSGLVLFNVAWNNGPLLGWNNPSVYSILAAGVLVLAAFVWVETRAVCPILPIRSLNSTVAWTLVLVGLGWGSFGIWLYYTWRFLLELRGQMALDIAIQFTPALIAGLLAAGVTGGLLTHTPVAFVMLISMLAFLAGELIAFTQPIQQLYWKQMFWSIIIMPFGMDMSFPAATVILSNHMAPEHQGLAASLVNTVVNYSISLGLGLAGTVEVATIKHAINASDHERGLRNAFYTSLALSGTAVVAGVLFFWRTYRKEGWAVMAH